MDVCVVCNTGGQCILPCNCTRPIHKHCFVKTRVGKTGCLVCKKPYTHIVVWNGDIASFDDAGFLYVYCLNAENRLHGPCTVYYPNRCMEFEGTYVNGIRSGDFVRYYETGNVMEKQHDDTYTMYNEDGSVLMQRKI